MPTVPQPYVYPISGIPGGQFNGTMSDRLTALIGETLPADTGLAINSDGVNVTITFTADLSTADKATLDTLVPECSEYFIITTDGGVTDLGDPATVTKASGLLSSTLITLQFKHGDGTNSNGHGESISLDAPLMTIDKVLGVWSGSGQFQFTVGSVTTSRGTAPVVITSDSLPSKTLNATWT